MPEFNPLSNFVGAVSHTLSNRWTFHLRQSTHTPFVVLRLRFPFGIAHEPADQPGLCKLLALTLKSGTSKQTALSIADALEYLAASLSVSVTHDAFTLHLTVSREQLDPALQIVHEILTDAVFPEHELQRARGQMKADCKKKLDMPGVLLGELFQSTLFGGHPYGRSTDGMESGVDDLSRDGVLRFYNEKLTACGAIVTVVGDVDEIKMRTFVENNWASHFKNSVNISTIQMDSPQPLGQRFFCLTDRPIAQAHIALGHTGPARGEPGHVPQMALNYILGGAGLSSRLTHHIRTQQGLAYSVYSSLTKRKFGGMFSVVLQTSAAHAPRAVTAIVKELEAIKADGVSDQELEDAKLYFSGHHPFTMETIERMALLIEQGVFFDLPPDYVERELAELQSLEQDDLRKAADMIDPKHWVLAIIGNEALIRQPIQELLHHYERQ